MKDIRDCLKATVESSGLKQCVVAERAEISPAKLSDIVNKRRKLDANDLFNLCAALGVTPNELYGIDSDQKSA